MGHDLEALAALKEWLPLAQVPQTLARVLRVPEAWDALKDGASRHRISLQGLNPPLTPAQIGLALLSVDKPEGLDLADLPSELMERVDDLWAQIEHRGGADWDLEQVQLIGLGIARELHARPESSWLIDRFRSDPERWRSPLACAWPVVPDRPGLIRQIAAWDDPAGLLLIANSLLANGDPQEAADTWPYLPAVLEARAVGTLYEMGEQPLAHALSSRQPASSDPPKARSVLEDPELLLLISAKQAASGDFESAQFSLDQATRQAGQLRRFMAEQAAALAREQCNPDLALIAVEAMGADSPSSWLRAKLALTCMLTGDAAAGEALLSGAGRTLQEDLARLPLSLRQGCRDKAKALLARLLDSREKIASRGALWTETLLQSAYELGDPDAIVKVLATHARVWGHSAEVRLDLAERLLDWGDPERAHLHAAFAVSLAPSAIRGQRLLAQALVALGRRADALPVWEVVSDQDASSLGDLLQCALDAGEIEVAERALERMPDSDPPSLQKQILRGKIMAALGDREAAIEFLRQVSESSPAAPEVWIALAGLFSQSGQISAGIETLAAAVQAAPDSDGIRMAYAELLEEVGRWSEALAACETAAPMDCANADWLQRRGNLSVQLGHTDQAIKILRRGLDLQPLNLTLRRSLAIALEEKGDAQAAWRLITPVLGRLPADDALLIGRLATHAAQRGQEDALAVGLRALGKAKEAHPNHLDVDYWLGEALLAAGEVEQAGTSFLRCLQPDEGGDPGRFRLASIGYAETALRMGDPHKAKEVLEAAFERSAADPRFLIQLSKVHRALGDVEAGLAAAELALEIEPSNGAAFEQLRVNARNSGNCSRAIGFIQGQVARESGDPVIWLRLAQMGIDCEDKSLARKALAEALFAGRFDPDLLDHAAGLLLEADEPRAASLVLRRAANLRPNDALRLEKWASLSESLGDWDHAFVAWSRLAEIMPGRPDPWLAAARALWEQGERDWSIQRLRDAIEVFPAAPEAYLALAKAFLNDGRELAALDLYHRAHSRFPDHAEITKQAGIVTLAHGTGEAALDILKKAVRIQPNDLEVLVALAGACSRLGRTEESIRILQQVNTRDGSPSIAASMLATLALETGDDRAAKEAIAHCLAASPATDHEYEALIGALADLGEWEQALGIAREWHASAHSQQSIITLIRLKLRLADGYWLLTRFCKATHHGPSSAMVSGESQREFGFLLQEARRFEVDAGLVSGFEARFRVSFGRPSPDDLDALETWLRSEPDSQSCEGLAIGFLRADMALRAIRALSDDAFSHRALAWDALILGLAFRRQKEHELAGIHLAEAKSHLTLRPYGEYQMAMNLSESASHRDAIEHLNAALSDCSVEPAWHHQLGRLYRGAGELDAALPHYQHAQQLEPQSDEYALGLARAFRDLGQPAAALAIYQDILNRSGEESGLWTEAGNVSLQAGDFHRAARLFERATSLSPQDPIALIGYAQAVAGRGEIKAARDLAQRALRAAPHEEVILLGLAKILQSEGRITDALEIYTKAADVSPNPLQVELDRCHLLIAAGEHEQAAQELEGLGDQYPDDDRIWGALAEAFEYGGKYAAAIEAASKAIHIAPRNTAYRLLIGRLCRKSGQLDRALHEMSMAREFATGDFRVPMELGQVYEARREQPRALDCYQEAIAQNPNHAQAFYRAGFVLKALKDYPRAAQMLKKAVQLDPRNIEAHHQLAAVRALELVHCTMSEAVGAT
jgi:tetratricopeptide (TPR) repeat protein